MAPAFRHERCANCHAVEADGFQSDAAHITTRGLPSGHPTVNAATNCTSCHTNNLLPSQGNINTGRHAAPASLDFRNRTDAQLCEMARGAAPEMVLNRLNQDKLTLWALGDGRRPQGDIRFSTGPLPPPSDRATEQYRDLAESRSVLGLGWHAMSHKPWGWIATWNEKIVQGTRFNEARGRKTWLQSPVCVAKLWQNYCVRLVWIGSSPMSDSSVSD